MNMMIKVVSTPDAVLSNINRFETEVRHSPELQGRLAYARAWYASKNERGEWQFAPSKFIGYEGLDAQQYIKSAEQGDGRRTEAQLQQWFSPVDPSSDLHKQLSSDLIAFLAKFGKVPSTKTRLNILKVAKQTNTEDEIVELMAAVAKSLPPHQLAKLRARIAE
jgi:hypothetical protein